MKFFYRKLAFALIVAVFLSSINLNVYTYKLSTLINTNDKDSVATLNNSSYSNTESYINNLNKNIDDSVHIAFAPSFGIQHSYAGGVVNAVGNFIAGVVNAIAAVIVSVVSIAGAIVTGVAGFVVGGILGLVTGNYTVMKNLEDIAHGLFSGAGMLLSNLADLGNAGILNVFNTGYCYGAGYNFLGGDPTKFSTDYVFTPCVAASSTTATLGFIPWTIDPFGTLAKSATDFDQGNNTFYGVSGLKTGFSNNGGVQEKDVNCADGNFAVGVSWWQHPNGFDDENVRILCSGYKDGSIYPEKNFTSSQLVETEVYTTKEPQTVDTGYPFAMYQSCIKIQNNSSSTSSGIYNTFSFNFIFPFIQKAFAVAPPTYYWQCSYYQDVTTSPDYKVSTADNHIGVEYLFSIPAGNLVASATTSDPSLSSNYFQSCTKYDNSQASNYSSNPSIWSQIQSYESSSSGQNNLWICTTKASQGNLFNFFSTDNGNTITEYSGSNNLLIQQAPDSQFTILNQSPSCQTQYTANCVELLALNDDTNYSNIDNFFPTTRMILSSYLPYRGISNSGNTSYDEAACPDNYVVTGLGVSPYGYNNEPYLNLFCRPLINSGNPGYLQENSGSWWIIPTAPTICQNDTHQESDCSTNASLNAFSSIVGEKNVFCPAGKVMVGVRFNNPGNSVSDQHVAIYCKSIQVSSGTSTPPQIFSK